MSESKANIGPKIVLEGEAAYKQSITDVNKSMSVLKSELKAVSAEFDGNANSVDALRTKNEVLLKQQTEQEKKLQLLRGALQDANKLYGEDSIQVQNWQIKLNNAYADLSKLNKEIDDNTKNLKEAENSTDKTATSIDKFGKEVKTAGDNSEKAGSQFKANLSSAAVIAGIVALASSIKNVSESLVNVVKDTAAYADDILTMSTQTGIATDTLQELNYMAELTDTSLETITSSMAKNIKSMASAQSGTDKYVEAYHKLGVEIVDTNDQLKDSESVFWDSIDALGSMANETERDATAMSLFGKSAQDLNPIIELGKDKVAEFANEARNMGAVLSTDTLDSLGKTDDALQRMYQQFDITKRGMGVALAPAITEAFETVTNEVDKADDKFTDFAEGAIGNVVDGFVWLTDNADLVAAGLKGIAAAIVTKKAADGITYTVTAYKTLTTATAAATAAQVGFNTASKASVIGAIASLAVGAGTAIYSYAKSASDAAEETRKLTDKTQILMEKNKELSQEVKSNTEERKKSLETIKSENSATKTLVDSLYDLSEEENKTASTKEQMLSLVNQINEAMPELNLTIDEQTGLLNKQRGEVEKLVEARIELSTAEALQGQLSKIALDKYNKEQELNNLLEIQKTKKEELIELQKEYAKAADMQYLNTGGINAVAMNFSNKILLVNKAMDDNEKKIKEAKAAVEEFGLSYEEALDYIGDHSSLDSATNALDKFLTKYQASLDQQNEEYADSLDDRTDAINASYKASEKALEKSQKAEKKILDKAHEEQTEAVEEASDKELEILEKAYNKKIKLIDKEYVAKIKLVDEDRYKALKEVQDKIDTIDTQSEAEDRARKLKEEAETRADLNLKISTATTVEDKMAAQQELADFEEDTAADRKETERNLQKDILENQKDTINDSYDAKVDGLKKEQKAEETKAEKTYKKEQEAVAAKYKQKKEELADLQELEDEALSDRQEAAKDSVDDQKTYALKKAQETFDSDLAKFKLNNALKYNDAVANEDKINKYMVEQNSIAIGSLKTSISTLQKSGVWDADYKSWGGLHKTAASTTLSQAEYDKIEDMVESGFTSALKKSTFSLTLNKKTFGTAVGSQINSMLK